MKSGARHSKSDNIEIKINDKANEIIEKNFRCWTYLKIKYT